MAKIRRNATIKRLAIKQAGGMTRKAAATTRPGTKATPQAKKRRPVKKIKLRVGFGQPFAAEDIAKRKRQFQRQQAQNKTIARSLVRRDAARGRQAINRVNFKRGRAVATERIRQFKEFEELEVLRDSRGRLMEKHVNSSWVSMIHLVGFQDKPALAITFHNGFTALYPTTNLMDYETMSAAASKGGYIWASLYHGKPGQGVAYQSISFPVR